MINEREKRELAEVIAMVIDAKFRDLYRELAAMTVTTLECCMEDLTKIMASQTQAHVMAMMQAAKGNDRASERVSQLMMEGPRKG